MSGTKLYQSKLITAALDRASEDRAIKPQHPLEIHNSQNDVVYFPDGDRICRRHSALLSKRHRRYYFGVTPSTLALNSGSFLYAPRIFSTANATCSAINA